MKMEVYPVDKEEVMTLKPRIEEAQRQAKNEMKDMVLGDRRQKKVQQRRRKGDDRDKEEV